MRRRIAVLLTVVAFVLIACIAAGPTVLRGSAHWLTIDEDAPGATVVILIGGDAQFERTADLWRRSAIKRVILFQAYPSRVRRMGIVLTGEERARRRLLALGVPEDAIEVEPCGWLTYSQFLRCLSQWLEQHPSDDAIVLCEALRSQTLSLERSRVAPPSEAARIHLVGLPDREFDPSDWWCHRNQVKMVFNGCVELLITWCFGELSADPDTWDPDEYERSLP
ncbi:MAG TPA: hypothetical protein VHV77_08965 [Pirellulales bacterium]|nr:hypothetical protein [Pirellulales bacterium]